MALACVSGCIAPKGKPEPSSVTAFRGKPAAYHRAFARACDSLLATHGTNTGASVRVDTKGATLPVILAEAHAHWVTVRPGRVHMDVTGPGEGCRVKDIFGLAWEQSESDPSVWELNAYYDRIPVAVYQEKKDTGTHNILQAKP